MFRRVLVANRGEIARRVMASCRHLGIETVAVYSDADAAVPHVREADQAVHLGPSPATESYLDIDRVVAAARRTEADAIHPGYGFLSENPAFAQAVTDSDITFVGPRPDTIRLMADKAAAKRHLAHAGVPVIPGSDEGLDDRELAEAAEQLGYPVLVKAVAGGGGKGMRAVHEPSELEDAVAAAKREAAAAFGDDRVILEKLVPAPRHVEIQVFGDHDGNVIHLFERECSIQRRHQKVVEEAPAPIPDELRAAIAAAGVRAAEAVDYLGAGTVEFLLSDETHDFYFLEMNTRLQVEHPVTELITGLDLVEWQLRVAAGEPLPLKQDDITAEGHAIEVRLYAEDATNDYLPQTGPVHRFLRPEAAGVRIDTGIEDGTEVTRFYDPMLAKVVAEGEDRDAAIDRLLWTLARSAVLGVTTNLDLLADVIGHQAFRAGELTTSFLEDHLPDWSPQPAPLELLLAAAVAIQHEHEQPASARSGDRDRTNPWRALGPWRSGGVGGWSVTFEEGGRRHDLEVTGRGGHYRVRHGDEQIRAKVTSVEDGGLHLEIDDHEVPATVVVEGTTVWAHVRGATRRLVVVPPTRHADPGLAGGGATFTSPMPGAVIAVPVTEGDAVAAGTTLIVVEAMKMEHPIKAPVAGTVAKLYVREGEPVDAETALVEFEPDDAGEVEA